MDDPYNLKRFRDAHLDAYEDALAEIVAGRKMSHWMWYIFPQFVGLGFSETSQFFAIKSVGEAQAYLADAVLGPRLVECAEAALGVSGKSAREIFGSPDDMKLKSCATLFATVAAPASVFELLLDRFFGGQRDDRTLQLLGACP